MSGPSNMANFTTNSYNLVKSGSWCVKPGSIYTNKRANFGYFNNKCGDPYTYYSFWYRRFPSQDNYLNCYNIPYIDPLLDNKAGYVFPSKTCGPSTFKNKSYNKISNGFRIYE